MPLLTTQGFATTWLVRRNRDEPSDAPKSANVAFSEWKDHRADLVIRNVMRRGKEMAPMLLLLSMLAFGPVFGDETLAAATKGDIINKALQEVHDLCAERTRLRIHHRDAHPRYAEIECRIAEIHDRTLREFETVATDAVVECSEEPLYGQPSYGVILYAIAIDDIAASELLLFHAAHVYRTRGSFPNLATTGAGWYFRPNANISNGTRFVVACIQNAPEEIENVKIGFMPNSDRARNPDRPYRTEIYRHDGKPLPPRP